MPVSSWAVPRGRPFALILCGLLLLLAGRARAQVHLEWARGDGGEACADGEEMRARLAARLGRPLFTEPATVWIEAWVAERADRPVVVLRSRTGTEEAERLLEAPSCAELERAALLVLAMIVERASPVETTAPALSEEPAAGACPAPSPPPPDEPVLREAAPSSLSARVVVELPLALGIVPGPAPALGLSASVALAPLRIELGARHVFESGVPIAGGHVAFAWTGLALGVGPEVTLLDSLVLGAAGGLEIGVASVAVSGPAVLDVSPQPTLAPYLAVVGRLSIDALAVDLGVRGSVPLLATRYLAGEQVVWAPEPVSLVAWLGVGIEIGRRR